MEHKITIVIHHYVRDVQNSTNSQIDRYNISVENFNKKLDYFMNKYEIISPEIFLNSIRYKTPLPQNSMLLTFDDGYIDHYNNVFPILMDHGLKAFFFPSALPILEGKMLNTNKLQIIFDRYDKKLIFNEVLRSLTRNSFRSAIKHLEGIIENKNTVLNEDYLLSYLEWDAPINVRNKVTNDLFNRLIGENEKELCKMYYMNIFQLKHMKKNGMHIGSHGYNHFCMSQINERLKYYEIINSLKLIEEVNMDIKDWVMCYPYGAYDDSTISILKNHGCIAGFTTIDKTADLNFDDYYVLPRVDITSTRI